MKDIEYILLLIDLIQDLNDDIQRKIDDNISQKTLTHVDCTAFLHDVNIRLSQIIPKLKRTL